MEIKTEEPGMVKMKKPEIKSIPYEDFKDNKYLEQLRANGTDVIVGCLDDLINWGRSNSVWPLTFATIAAILSLWQWVPHVMTFPASGLKRPGSAGLFSSIYESIGIFSYGI